MKINMLKRWLIFCFLVLIEKTKSEPLTPCYIIFGDSMFDNGNNNNLSTTAKVNYPPYGIDFPDGPTGRFSNGRNQIDFIAQHLGFQKFIQPYATATDDDIILGVNYASGGAGIRDETGIALGGRISLNNQIENHKKTISRLIKKMGNRNAAIGHLNKCMYSVGPGNNDYINNYFAPDFYNSSKEYNTQQYADVLITQYTQQLKTLYSLGARKVAIHGVWLIGCTPRAAARYNLKVGCAQDQNDAAAILNKKLLSLVDVLNKELKGATFTFINTYGVRSIDFLTSLGFTVLDRSCCKVKRGEDLCIPNETPEAGREIHLFWDGVHPTEQVCKLAAANAFTGFAPINVYPYNISRLAQL